MPHLNLVLNGTYAEMASVFVWHVALISNHCYQEVDLKEQAYV
jgi:hypothetical protein